MASSRYNVVFETGTDRRQRFSNELHNYTNPGVLLGYWFEERARIEAETDQLFDKYRKNDLIFQKLDRYLNTLSIPVQLTRNLDGFLHHGDIIRLKWTHEDDGKFFLSALPMDIETDGSFSDPCLAVATEDSRILIRSAFHVFRNNNNIPNHIPLVFGENIQICTIKSSGSRFLHCNPKAFNSFARQSKHQEVTWEKELSIRCLWKVLSEDKKMRRRLEGQFIPVNTNVVIAHLTTGQCLALERETSIGTTFGFEKEVSGHTYFNSLKVEGIENKWQFEAPLVSPCDYGQPMNIPQCKID